MKKVVYIICSALLGFFLSLLVHAVTESVYLTYLERNNGNPTWSTLFGVGQCALPNWVNVGIGVAGVVFGIWLGFVWWRIVYVEKRHWRFRNKQKHADI